MAVLMAIIFDNDSGKLLGVARALEAGCRAAGAEVELYRLEATREASTKDLSGLPVLGPDDLPSVLGRADAILLGSPVCSGRPSLPMAAFLEHCSTITYIPAASLAGKVGLPFCCYGQRGDLSAAAGVCQTLLGFFMEAGMLALGNVPISKEPDEDSRTVINFPFPAVELQVEGTHKIDGLTGAWALTDSEQRVAELAGERAAEVTAKLQLAEIVAALR